MTRHVRLPEAVQVEEALGETFGRCHVSAAAAVGEGVTAAQTEPVAEVLVQLRVRRQASFISAEEHRKKILSRWQLLNNDTVWSQLSGVGGASYL